MTNSHPEPEPSASSADLAAELAGMLRTGVTVEACRRAPALSELEIVRAKAASQSADDRAVSVNNLVREACAAVDDISSGPTAILLAVAPGYRGRLLKDRRKHAAAQLHVDPDHLRKSRELPLLEAVADELYAMDSAYRLRHRHRAERPRERSHLGIDWLEQHRSYRRIWTPVSGVRNDLEVLLTYFRAAHAKGLTPYDVDDGARADISDRLSSMTWHLARFTTEIERFVEREGGLWLLSNAEKEICAADAIYRMQTALPFGEADISWIRGLLMGSQHEELEPFTDLLIEAGERRRELMATWVDWAWALVESEARTARASTRPVACDHWIDAGDEFIRLLEDDWYRVADWYRLPLQGHESAAD